MPWQLTPLEGKFILHYLIPTSRNVRKRTFRCVHPDLDHPAHSHSWKDNDAKFRHADNEDSNQTALMQADLSLC